MSKFLKCVVNIIMILAILVAGGLLIPPFAGVTTVIVDDVNMDTNLSKGSVTYALNKDSADLKKGNKVLVNEESGRYVYEVTAVDGEAYTLEDKLSTDGQTQERTTRSMVKKVVLTVPFIGYVSMALRTTEGLIIVGLAVVFVIILFILAEIWKKDEEDDDEADDEEEPQLSRRQEKKARKAAGKAAKKEAKKEAKQAKKHAVDADEADDADVQPSNAEPIMENRDTQEEAPADTQKDFFEEVGSELAADVADMMQQQEEEAAVSEETPQEEALNGKKLAIPAYTREELLEKAQKAGETPKVTEDELSGVTLLDYSDLL